MQRSLPTPKYYIMFVFMRLFMHQESLYRHLVPTKHTHTLTRDHPGTNACLNKFAYRANSRPCAHGKQHSACVTKSRMMDYKYVGSARGGCTCEPICVCLCAGVVDVCTPPPPTAVEVLDYDTRATRHTHALMTL